MTTNFLIFTATEKLIIDSYTCYFIRMKNLIDINILLSKMIYEYENNKINH